MNYTRMENGGMRGVDKAEWNEMTESFVNRFEGEEDRVSRSREIQNSSYQSKFSCSRQ